MSTGPRTPEGRAKALQALRQARADPLTRQAIGAKLRALWADPGYRLRVMAGRWRVLDACGWQRVEASGYARDVMDAHLERRRRWRERLSRLLVLVQD